MDFKGTFVKNSWSLRSDDQRLELQSTENANKKDDVVIWPYEEKWAGALVYGCTKRANPLSHQATRM